jgi:sulfate transport system permease protein
MAGAATSLGDRAKETQIQKPRRATTEPPVVRALLIAVALAFLGFFLFLPVVIVFVEAFKDGISAYVAAIVTDDTLSAVRLTITTALIAVPLNIVFGVAAAWAVARFEFPGKNLLITLIDLPFAVSPVISGMIFVLLFGAQGALGPLLSKYDIHIIFAQPGIVLATTFVTFPFVARELIPFMQSQGPEEEQAALVLGASPFQMFFRVTLPNAKWGLLYGIVLCTARAMGEFGAVSVVSGHIRGQTNTIPLHVEVLYNEYQFSAAFAVSTLLVTLALLTLAAKRLIEIRAAKERRDASADSVTGGSGAEPEAAWKRAA